MQKDRGWNGVQPLGFLSHYLGLLITASKNKNNNKITIISKVSLSPSCCKPIIPKNDQIVKGVSDSEIPLTNHLPMV